MLKKYSLECIVVVSGAVVMILELVGSRILAPHVGTSLHVWTSIIGIVLGSLSLGYWWGGKLADKIPKYSVLSGILLVAALFIGMIVFLEGVLAGFLSETSLSLPVRTVLASIVLFALPSILLGMVSPYAARLKMEDVEHSGSTIGRLYALSTIGSIGGTFLAGFYLIAQFGSMRILMFLFSALIILSGIAFLRHRKMSAKMVMAFIGILIVGNIFNVYYVRTVSAVDIDTPYNRAWIVEDIDEATNRPRRSLITNPNVAQSSMYTDQDNDLVHIYTRHFRLIDHFMPDLRSVLMIGGGAYSYPKDFLKTHGGDVEMDVIEIDPGITKIAREYFGLQDDDRMHIYHEDSRVYLNRNTKKYDAVIMDAFTAEGAVPFSLSTREALQKVYDALDDEGMVVVNTFGSVDGYHGRYLRSQYATYKDVFPYVYILPVLGEKNTMKQQNVMLVAIKSDVEPSWESDTEELQKYLNNKVNRHIAEDAIVLTDDFAPVERLGSLIQ